MKLIWFEWKYILQGVMYTSLVLVPIALYYRNRYHLYVEKYDNLLQTPMEQVKKTKKGKKATKEIKELPRQVIMPVFYEQMTDEEKRKFVNDERVRLNSILAEKNHARASKKSNSLELKI